MRLAILFSSFLFVILQYTYWFGENGHFAQRQLEIDLQAQVDFNQKLHERNGKLRREIAYLKGDDGAIEEIARSELGMIKEGEKFYLILENDQKQ